MSLELYLLGVLIAIGGLIYLIRRTNISFPSLGGSNLLSQFGSARKWIYGIGFVLILLNYPAIVEWVAPYLASFSAAESWGVDVETIKNYQWEFLGAVIAVILLGVVAWQWALGIFVGTFILALTATTMFTPTLQPSCNFKERIGFEMGGQHFFPRWLSGTAGVGNNNPRILDARNGVVATLCPGDSGYVKVVAGTRLEVDFTDGFALDFDTIRKLALGEDRGYLIGQFVQAGRDPRADHNPNYDLYQVRVMDHMFGDTTGSGHDSIQVVVRTVPR